MCIRDRYITVVASAQLSDERVLAVGTGLQVTDGGANSNITIDTFVSTTSVTGIVRLQDSATDGTVDRAITPSAVYDVSGVLQTNVDTNTSSIATNAANITATGEINSTDILEVSGVAATNASNISTNTSNISTNTSNISTNTSNISTYTSNISTNTTV